MQRSEATSFSTESSKNYILYFIQALYGKVQEQFWCAVALSYSLQISLISQPLIFIFIMKGKRNCRTTSAFLCSHSLSCVNLTQVLVLPGFLLLLNDIQSV